jgi:hypothetical protein
MKGGIPRVPQVEKIRRAFSLHAGAALVYEIGYQPSAPGAALVHENGGSASTHLFTSQL